MQDQKNAGTECTIQNAGTECTIQNASYRMQVQNAPYRMQDQKKAGTECIIQNAGTECIIQNAGPKECRMECRMEHTMQINHILFGTRVQDLRSNCWVCVWPLWQYIKIHFKYFLRLKKIKMTILYTTSCCPKTLLQCPHPSWCCLRSWNFSSSSVFSASRIVFSYPV